MSHPHPCDSLQLVVSTDASQSGYQNDQNNDELLRSSQQQTMILESSSSSEFMETQHQEDEPLSPSSFSAPNTPSSSSTMITTLELHPNVILGIPEDDISVNGGDGDRPFMCAVCHASYKTKTHMRRHMHVHMSSRPFPCPECGKGFNRKEHLNKHLEAVHSGNKHHCPYCQKQISRMDHLRRHIKNMHTMPLDEVADDNDKGTVLKVQVKGRRHKAQLSFLTPSFPPGTIGQTIITPIPLEASNGTGKCSSAMKAEATEDTSSNEIRENNDEDSTTMTIIPKNIVGPGEGVATLAVQSTPTQKVLVHQRLPSGTSVNLNTVTSGFAGLADLSLQLGGHASNIVCKQESHDDIGEDNNSEQLQVQIFTCGECNSTFTSESDRPLNPTCKSCHLTTHSRTMHTPSKSQPHRCPDCPRAYTRREKLTEHIRCVHQGQKFGCEFCGKELSRKDHVLRHIRSVHPEVYAASFAEMDDSKIMLDEHGRLVSVSSESSNSVQGKKKRTPTSQSFNLPSLGDVGVLLRSVCHICLKVFGTAYHLTRHVDSCHSGDVRRFNCTACNKMFKRKDHLTKHIKSHCPALKQEQAQNHASQQQMQHSTISELENIAMKAKATSFRSATHKYDITASKLEEQRQDSDLSQNEGGQEEEFAVLSEESESSSNCHHAIFQNLQIEMDLSTTPDEDSIPTASSSSTVVSSVLTTTASHGNAGSDSGVIIGGTGISIKQSNGSEATGTEFSLAVINSFMQGGVNVVVVDEEISNFLQQTSSHLTTTFPCAQCQKEFPQRDQLIAHALQEHTTEALLQAHTQQQHHHHQHISDISFPDF